MKMVKSFKPLTILAKKAPLYMFDWVINTPLHMNHFFLIRFSFQIGGKKSTHVPGVVSKSISSNND